LSSAEVHVDVDGNVAEIVIDRPPVNAFSTELYQTVTSAFSNVSLDGAVDVVLVRSANPKVFSAGADIRELERIIGSGRFDLDETRQAAARELSTSVLNCSQPTIALLNGPALGAGLVLAACCDLRYASANATLGLPEINLVRCGGAAQLKRLLPQGVLRELYFTGEPLSASEAAHHGLVNRVYPHGDALLEAARVVAGTIAGKSPTALRFAKQALDEIEFLPHDDAYPLEQAYALRLARHPDALEAARAFLDKRRPVWAR
jgi:enoyl-CoA hydratase/carnithine racemase